MQTIENILPKELICKQAENSQDDMPLEESIVLLSVGRFCDAKNFDNIPDICRRLLEDGLDVKWYLIGYGGDEPLIPPENHRSRDAGTCYYSRQKGQPISVYASL